MDFGKLPDVIEVDFSLPVEEKRSLEVLARAKSAEPARAYVGAPVWTTRQWIGKVYPKTVAQKDLLHHYSRQFNCIELNTTHYRIPDPVTVALWREATPPEFRFCPKLHQEISHTRALANTGAMVREFHAAVAGLGDRLGVSFLQLPPGFGPAELPRLEAFVRELPTGFRVAIEFRHPGWFRKRQLHPAAADLLERAGIPTVITDVAGRRDVAHGTLTAPVAIVRFVGNALDPSDYTRIDQWVARLRRWLEAGLREIWFFVHQPENILSPELIRYLIDGLNAAWPLGLRLWEPMDRGNQLELFG